VSSSSRGFKWLRRVAIIVSLLFAVLIGSIFIISRADGPVFVFAGGPLATGDFVELGSLDWRALDALLEFELEIVGEASSRTLWFSVHEGVPYVACDLDCIGGLLARWPQQIERDNRVVIRIDAKRVEGLLTHVPHGSVEYEVVRAGRNMKYSGNTGKRAGSEAAAHGAVVGVGEVLTGRSKRSEPGDRLYRIDPR
jgi:hypothetical protein